MMPGALRFRDGAVLWYQYNSVGDRCSPGLFPSLADARNAYESECWKICSGVHAAEPVEIVIFYGATYHWDGEACRRCMAIVSCLDPFEPDIAKLGTPAWAEGLYLPPNREVK
jgi:hypothetical protein